MDNIDPLGWAVQSGLEGFMYRIGDMIYGVGNVNASTNRSVTDSLFVNMVTWNVDPYSFQQVKDWQDYSMVAFIIVGVLALVLAFISSRGYFKTVDELLGEGYTHNRIVDTVLALVIIPFATVYGVWVVLQLNYILSVFIANYMIMTIPQTADNFVLYIAMGIAYNLITFVMIIRAVLIVMYVAMAIIVGSAYSIIELREKATKHVKSFVSIVFLQPKILFIVLIGIVVIVNLPIVFIPIKSTAYVALSCYVVWIGLKAVAGDSMTTLIKVAVFRRMR